MRLLVGLVPLCGVLACHALAQQSKGEDKTVARLKEIIAVQSKWGVSQPVPGASLEVVKKSAQKDLTGRTVVRYNFKAGGLSTNTTYRMEYWPVGGSVHGFQLLSKGLKIDSEGVVVCGPSLACGDKKQPQVPLEVAISATSIGEPARFALVSEKNPKVWVTGLAMSFPLRATDQGCQLEITRMFPNGELLLLSGSGFPANAQLTIAGDSAGEKHTSTSTTDSAGKFHAAELPFVTGKVYGIVTFSVAEGADCHPSISARWGDGSREFQ